VLINNKTFRLLDLLLQWLEKLMVGSAIG